MRRALPLLVLVACKSAPVASPTGSAGARDAAPATPDFLRDPREAHLSSIEQLSNGGENAEAYWSFDGTQLIFQTTREGYACDQIMRMPADGSAPPALVSTGKGRTTCSYFLPGDREVLYASTHGVDAACPPAPDHSQGYVWALYDYDIYRANVDGSNLRKLTDRAGYDAEGTVCAKDGSIVFTSDRDGDLELYRMDADGKNVKRLTSTPGYDGGAFFNADCTKLVWRASRPTGKELEEFQRLLGQRLVRPTQLELYVGNADGSDARQVTYLGAASFAPYFFPSGNRIIFSSNYGDPKGREFDLWAVDTDGTDLERITYSEGFDGFPMFSPDGSRLAFSSNRHHAKEGDTNVFVARWVEGPPTVRDERGPDRFAAIVSYLADDELAGRAVGTPGIELAAKYIEDNLRATGVEPAIAGSFRLPFEATTAVERGADSVAIDGGAVAAEAYLPLSFSSSTSVEAPVVDVGYGIAAKGIRDDYKRKDVEGKIVLVRRFTPPGKAFTDDVKRRESDLHAKAISARLHGAIGMIVVDAEKTDEAPLPALDPSDGDLGIVAVALTRAAAQPLAAGKHRARLTVALTPRKARTDDIVGVIRAGASDRKAGAIVIGAHYDHLGMGGRDSLEAKPGIHNGADDNASGVAALLEAARLLVERRGELRRDVWIVAFSGEEMGVLGSTHFVQHLPEGLAGAPIVAMLNMDMVGRMRDDTVQALGSESAAEWPAILEPICKDLGVHCVGSGNGYGPSDHMPFFVAKIPVLHFFTGSHLDYHRTSDDADKINAAGGARVGEIVAATALAVAGREALTYRAAAPPPKGGDTPLRGASLGTIPAYAEEGPPQPGVLLSDVVPEGPAAKAGLKGGDRIVAVGGMEIRTIYDLMYVLTNAKPGAKAKVVYVRDGKKATVEATFGPPRRR